MYRYIYIYIILCTSDISRWVWCAFRANKNLSGVNNKVRNFRAYSELPTSMHGFIRMFITVKACYSWYLEELKASPCLAQHLTVGLSVQAQQKALLLSGKAVCAWRWLHRMRKQIGALND